MKKIKNLTDLQSAIDNRCEFKQDIGGRKFDLSVVTVLSMKLIDLINMIKNEQLFYTPEM